MEEGSGKEALTEAVLMMVSVDIYRQCDYDGR